MIEPAGEEGVTLPFQARRPWDFPAAIGSSEQSAARDACGLERFGPWDVAVSDSVPARSLMADSSVPIALQGYDVVSYFQDGAAVRGVPEHASDWDGRRWLFASAAHRAQFASAPEHYLPQYGGSCALAASFGRDGVSCSPESFAVVDGKLYLTANRLVRALWKALPGRIAAADAQWKPTSKR
jgi:hypothetical protein